jgi:hypothetical protein
VTAAAMTDAYLAQIEAAHAILANRTATGTELRAAAEQALAAVSAIDTAIAAMPEREATVLAAMAPPSSLWLVGRSVAETRNMLAALKDEHGLRALDRKISSGIAGLLAARVRDVEKAEGARDEARRPFAAQTRRATDLAEKVVAIYPPNAARIVDLFFDDVLISRLGKITYSRLPPPQGTHTRYERTWHVARVLATSAVMSATKLPEHWPPRHSDYSVLEQRQHFEEDDDDIIRPLRALINKRPSSESEIDAAIARAQSALLAEYRKAADAIVDLLRLDGTVTAAEHQQKYPDHALVWDQALFPSYWLIGRMRQRIVLPSLDGLARAAE